MLNCRSSNRMLGYAKNRLADIKTANHKTKTQSRSILIQLGKGHTAQDPDKVYELEVWKPTNLTPEHLAKWERTQKRLGIPPRYTRVCRGWKALPPKPIYKSDEEERQHILQQIEEEKEVRRKVNIQLAYLLCEIGFGDRVVGQLAKLPTLHKATINKVINYYDLDGYYQDEYWVFGKDLPKRLPNEVQVSDWEAQCYWDELADIGIEGDYDENYYDYTENDYEEEVKQEEREDNDSDEEDDEDGEVCETTSSEDDREIDNTNGYNGVRGADAGRWNGDEQAGESDEE